jgi:hypothetical protein
MQSLRLIALRYKVPPSRAEPGWEAIALPAPFHHTGTLKNPNIVTASEIADFVYCPEAWRLAQCGHQSANRVARRWQDRLEAEAGRIMGEVGIPPERIGARDIASGVRQNFFPDERDGGGLATGGGVTLDSGIFNPELMAILSPEAREAWAHASVRTRAKACVAHEDMEYRAGTHELAIELAPEKDLLIGRHARKLLRTIRLGEQRRH